VGEKFELSLLGGSVERRYRRLRPDVERIAWHKLDGDALSPSLRERARGFWTGAALAEHRAAAASAAMLQAMIEARAPVDLVASASGFVLDELAHVELCARITAALGGGTPLAYDAATLVPPTTPSLGPLGRAAELVLQVSCVSESFLQPMQRIQLAGETHAVLRAVGARISKDESQHAGFGWIFFDWALPLLDEPSRVALRTRAAAAVQALRDRPVADDGEADVFGWMSAATYRREAPRIIDEHIAGPLRDRGLL
jgi:hypothetical protein